MLKKLAPILSILLIASNAFATKPAQEEKLKNRADYFQTGMFGLTLAAAFGALSYKTDTPLFTKKVSGFTLKKCTHVASFCAASVLGLLSLSAVAMAALAPEQIALPEQNPSISTAPTSAQESGAAAKLAADTDAANKQKSPLTA